MMTREELKRIYDELWRGNEDAFVFLLEYFIPFSRYRFELVRKEEGTQRLIRPMVYHSPYIKLRITHDFEQYRGVGGILFMYERISTPAHADLKNCKIWVVSEVKRTPWLHYYLSGIQPQDTQPRPPLPVEEAFKRRMETDEKLRGLQLRSDGFEPAYAAAFEAFCWEYYGERFFRLFRPENQAERDALARYVYEYYRVHYSAEAIKEWEENPHMPPPWKICL